MYEKLLSMTWDQMMESDYCFKSNAARKIIQINGSEFDKNDDSIIIVYYNVYTGNPMILTQRYSHTVEDIVPPQIDGFSMYCKNDLEDDYVCTEVTYVLCDLQASLED